MPLSSEKCQTPTYSGQVLLVMGGRIPCPARSPQQARKTVFDVSSGILTQTVDSPFSFQ